MRAMLPLGLTGLVMTVLSGCAESPTGGPKPVIPVTSMPTLGVLRGTVDLDRGTLEFASIAPSGLGAHFIGDEETSVAPLDTMGMYVFFVQEPVPGQPCGGCFARIANYEGTMSFDAPNRKYFHWPERLNPMGSALRDTTRVRRAWTFETSAGVRSFSFNVLVAAPWPAPYETR